ncbi:MAG TPA: FMN-binding negative transcriptional regulator [Caulobacteraceae bacterium]|nr:FMN-binding negative transcriptional regulator [Caulobacteraceae bacterium]
MHPAPYFKETDKAVLSALVAERGFGLIIGLDGARPVAAHAAFLLEGRTLRFHLSRANALTPVLEAGGTALAVVSGPDAYVSPDWYGLDDQVPTWNYVSVEMEGPVTPVGDEAATVLLDDLSAHFEGKLAPKPPWTRQKMTPAYFERLLRGIRAFEMRVERLEGITKLSQNKPPEVVTRTAEALEALNDPNAREVARLMREPRRPG